MNGREDLSDNWGRLSSDTNLDIHLESNLGMQDSPLEWTRPLEGSKTVRPLPLSPYGQVLFQNVMDPFLPDTPFLGGVPNLSDRVWTNTIGRVVNNIPEQICRHCRHAGRQNYGDGANSPTLNLNELNYGMASNTEALGALIQQGQSNFSIAGSPMEAAATPNSHSLQGQNTEKGRPTIDQMFETIQKNQMVLLTHLSNFQSSTETRLESLEKKAGTSIEQVGALGGKLKSAIIDISSVKKQSAENATDIATLSSSLKSALERISTLENDVLNLDRYNRQYSLKILDIPEEPNEDCKMKVAGVIKNNKLLPNCENLNASTISYQIENAHRIGKIYMGRNRHMLVRFHAVPFRDTIMRTVKKLPGGKTREGYVLHDDMNITDRQIKDRHSEITKSHYDFDRTHVLYKRGKFLVKGQWLTEEEYQRSRPSM